MPPAAAGLAVIMIGAVAITVATQGVTPAVVPCFVGSLAAIGGVRIARGKVTATDGRFAEAKEVVGGAGECELRELVFLAP